MEHRDQLNGIVMGVVRGWHGRRDDFAGAWSEVRRQLRSLRDTSTTLSEDERTALELLRQFQAAL